MKKFTNKNIIELINDGYTKIPLLDSKEVDQLINECEELHDKYGNKKSEQIGLAYPSKGHQKKKSVILMVSLEKNDELPSTHEIGPLFKEYLRFNNEIITRVTGISIPQNSRYMINYRKYLGETDPVFEHFDGEYLKGFVDEPNYHFFEEALLPRYVALLTLHGGGENEGAIITNVASGEEISPSCVVGDMLIFDNIRFKHYVPKLIKPRILLGVRNFDFLPFHYVLTPIDGYITLGDKINYGYIKPISCEEAKKLMLSKKINSD